MNDAHGHRNLAGGSRRGSGRLSESIGHTLTSAPHPFDDDQLRGCHNRVTLALLRLGARISLPAWSQVLRRDPCAYCGAKPGRSGMVLDRRHGRSKMTLDHIVPRSAGATGWHPSVENGTAACPSCNQRKGSASLLEFLASGGMRPSLAPTRPKTVLESMAEIGGLAHAREIANLMGVEPYQVGMELSALRGRGVVERIGRRWRVQQCVD